MLLDYNKSIEQVLRTGKYLTKYKIFSEEMALCQYLYAEEKKSKEEIFEIWKKTENPMTEAYELSHDDDVLKSNFNFVWNLAMQRNPLYATHYRPAKIWQEELDYINSLPIPQWYRKYLVCLLALSKVFPSQPFPYSSLTIESVILKKIGMDCAMKAAKRMKMSKWNNELHLYEVIMHPLKSTLQMKVLIDYNIKDAGGTINYDGIPLIVTDNDLTGIEVVLDQCAPGSVNCAECGKQLFVGPNYKYPRPLCENCKRLSNHFRTCAICGRSFRVSPHYQKQVPLCDNCKPLTGKEFAALCGFSVVTLNKLEKSGKFIPRRDIRGHKFYVALDKQKAVSLVKRSKKPS